MPDALAVIERAVRAALESHSNVHRGAGHHGLASTRLYDEAKAVVLEGLGFDRSTHDVVFCSPRRAGRLLAALGEQDVRCLSSVELGLPLGVRAIVVGKKTLARAPAQPTGGGTARMVSADRVTWAHGAERFEAGTPATVNVIAFARALQEADAVRGDAAKGATAGDEVGGGASEVDPLAGLSGEPLLAALRKTLVGREVLVPTLVGRRRYVNLDNAASTPTFEPIWQAVRQSWRLPASARPALVEAGKRACAELLGAPPDVYDVVFTANTTEAVNLVAESLRERPASGVEPVVLNSALEHNSNELPWRGTSASPATVVHVPVDRDGFLDLGALEAQLRAHNEQHAHGRRRVELVAVTGASNVLGSCPPLAPVAELAHRYGARLLVDAAQLVAHRPIDMQASGVDYLAFSGHKVYAPFGTGVLLARKGLLAYGPSELQHISSSAEENVGGIAGLTVALTLLRRIGLDTIARHELGLLQRTLAGLARLPAVTVYGITDADSPKLPHKTAVVAFAVKGRMPGTVARRLAEQGGVGVRSGCHCAHMLVKGMLGVPPWAQRLQHVMLWAWSGLSLPGVVRASFGMQNTTDDVDRFLETLGAIATGPRVERLGRPMSAYLDEAIARVYRPPTAAAGDGR